MDRYSYPADNYSRSGYGRRRRDDEDLYDRGYNFNRGRREIRRDFTRMRYDSAYPRLCQVCHLSIANAQQWESHCAGKKHVKNLKKLNGEDYYNNGIPLPAELTEEMIEDDKEYIEVNAITSARTCTLCYVDFTSDVMEESHRTGKRHLKNVKYAKQGLLNGQADASLGKCQICDVVFSSPAMRLAHMNGRRHREECQYRGIPLERTSTKKRSNVETNETRAAKRVKVSERDSPKKVRKEKPVKREPTRKDMPSPKTSPKKKGVEKKKTKVRKTVNLKKTSTSKANKPTKSKTNSQKKKESTEYKNKTVTESPKVNSSHTKPVLPQTSTKTKETPKPVTQETKETEVEVQASEEVAPVEQECPTQEESLLPHQLIEKEADEAYEKYTQIAETNPAQAHVLYAEYREIYKRYEVAYQEYLDNLNLDS